MYLGRLIIVKSWYSQTIISFIHRIVFRACDSLTCIKFDNYKKIVSVQIPRVFDSRFTNLPSRVFGTRQMLRLHIVYSNESRKIEPY